MAQEEVGNLVVKLGMDGTGFQNGVSNLNREMKVVQSEFQAAAAKIGGFGKDTESLKLKADSLTKQMELQRQKVDALQVAFQRSADSKGRDASATQNLQIKLNKATAEFHTLENALKSTNGEIDKQSSFWRKLEGEVTTSGNKVKGQVLSIGQTIKTGLVFGVAYEGLQQLKNGFEAVVGGGIKFNAAMETNTIAFTQMLGSAEKAKDMLQDLTQFAATTPFELPQVEDLAKKLLAFGFAGKDIVPMLTSIGDAAAGLGLGAEGANRLALAIGQIQAKGKVQSDELLQMTEAGVPALQILAQSFGVTTAKMQDMVTKGTVPADKAIQALLGGMEQRFPHMMDAQSKSFSGLMSNLSDNLNQAFGTVMKPVFDWLTTDALPKAVDLTTKFTAALKEGGLVQAFKTIIPPDVVDGFITFGNTVKDVFNFVKENWQIIVAAFVSIGAGMAVFSATTAVLETVVALKAAFAAAQLASGGVMTFRIALAALTGANPIVLAISVAIGLLAAAAFLIIKNWDPISAFFKKLWSDVSTATVTAWNSVKTFFAETWAWMQSFFSQWGPLILTFIMPFIGIPLLIHQHWGEISAFLSEVWTRISDTANTVWTAITSFLSGVWDGVAGVIKTAVGGIADHLNMIWMGISSSVIYTWHGIQNYFTAVWDIIKTIFLGAILLIVDLVTGNFTAMQSDAIQIWDKLKGYFGDVLNAIQQVFTGAWGLIEDIFSLSLYEIQRVAETVWNGLKSFFTSLWKDITSVADAAWNGFKTATVNLFNATVQGAKDIWNGLMNFFSEMPGKLYDFAVSMFGRMKDGTVSTVDGVKSAIVDGIQVAINWIEELPDRLLQLGKDIIQGLINGMKNMLGRVKDTVKETASAVADGIRNLLGIKSPSRVMMEIGGYAGEGLAIGLGNRIGDVSKQAGLLGQAVIPKLSGSANVNASGSGSGGSAINNNFDGMFAGAVFQVRSDNDIKQLAQEIFNLTQSRSRGQGMVSLPI